MMAKRDNLPTSLLPISTQKEDQQQTIGLQNKLHRSCHSERSKSNETIIVNGQTEASNVQSDHHELSIVPERCVESSKPIQASFISNKQTVVIVKVALMVILALVLVGILSIPFFKVTESLKNSVSVEDTRGPSCQSILLERQSCFPDGKNVSELEASLIKVAENKANEYRGPLNQLLLLLPVSEQCGQELVVLVCAAVFIELCDSSKISILLQDCEMTTTETCSTDFPQIQSTLENLDIPLTCDSLMRQKTVVLGSGSGVYNPQNRNVTPELNNIFRNCSDGFFVDDSGLCKPECGEWWPRTPHELKLMATLNITVASVGVISILLVIILSCLNYKTIFQFPSIFILYQMFSILALLGNILVSYVDIKGRLCNYRDLREVIKPGNASTFCIISGAAWIYFTVQVALLLLCQISMTFVSVFWPFKYQYWRNLGYFKYLHSAFIIVALILPLIPVFITLIFGNYNIVIFYPPSCGGNLVETVFYSHLFPMMCSTTVCIYLVILIFVKFFLEECVSRKKQNTRKRQVEIKIFSLLLFYVVSWPVFFGISTYDLIEALKWPVALGEYFVCEELGTNECSSESFSEISVVPGLLFTLICLYPISFLIYFVKCSMLESH